MENILLLIHVITALAIIGFVLIQKGKGAEAGASFGAGASQTVFGSTGSWNFFSKVTAILATLFFVTSLGLAVTAKDRANVADKVLPAIEQYRQDTQSAEQETDSPADEFEIPVLESEGSDVPVSESDIPEF